MHKYSSALVGLLAWAALASSANAHIKLLQPESWLNEDDVGGPQKGGPCGPGGFDDVEPTPLSMKVTTAKAGDTIMVEFEETVHHPGWFRIALAEDPSEFEEIAFPNTSDCNYDLSKVPTEPHGNVLADGLGMDSNIGGPNRKLMEMVKLPDTPCEKCTLQVIQVMADALHAPPGCIYYHCAELKILPRDGAAAGSGGSAAATAGASGVGGAGAADSGSAGLSGARAGAGGATTQPVTSTSAGAGAGALGAKALAGAGAAGAKGLAGAAAAAGSGVATPSADTTTEPSDGGCSVARPAPGSSLALGALCFVLAALWLARRKLR